MRAPHNFRLCSLPVVLLCCGLLGCAHKVQAQQPAEVSETTEELVEERLSRIENLTFDFEYLVELDQQLRRQPLDLNKADAEDLEDLVVLQLLTKRQVQALLDYRQTLGDLTSIYELQAVPLLDVATIRQLLPYVSVGSTRQLRKREVRQLFTEGRYTTLVRTNYSFPLAEGYLRSPSDSVAHYLGSPWGLYGRFRYHYGTRLSWGFTVQKDAGEELFGPSQPHGFDFYSAHFFYRGSGWLRGLALGDYALNAGQGLLLGAGFGVNKSSFVTTIKNNGRFLWPYTSINEFQFFRGVAATFGWGKLQMSAFGSSRKVDANVVSTDILSDELIITSLKTNGLHRTRSELADKHALGLRMAGLHSQYTHRRGTAGIVALHNALSHALEPDVEPYNQFYFRGSSLSNVGAYFDYSIANLNLFGEGALSFPGGKGLVAGMLTSLHPRIDVALLFRNYDRDFTTLYQRAFSESSEPKNESGLYGGLVVRVSRQLTLQTYADAYHRPWLSFRADAPSRGNDLLAQLTYKPHKMLEMYVRWKDERKQQNAATSELPVDFLTEERRTSLRLHVSYKITPSVQLRSRLEWVYFQQEGMSPQRGFLAYQDIIWQQLGMPLQLKGRFALFDASDYDARVYAYENDVLYVYSVPAFYHTGMRSYLVVRYDVLRSVSLWVRWASTYYTSLKTIGSGLNAVQGPWKHEIKTALRLQF